MSSGFSIMIAAAEEDSPVLEIRAWSRRYRGATRVLLTPNLLASFGATVCGFPCAPDDVREFAFGTRAKFDEAGFDPPGGFCSLRFRAVDALGHAMLDIEMIDDGCYWDAATATFSIRIDPACVDQLVSGVEMMDLCRCGAVAIETSV